MSLKFPKIKSLTIMLLACLTLLVELPASGQRHGRGRGHGRGGVTVVNPTPGIPTSSRGRGRNWTPRTRRGRYVRAVIRRRNNRNMFPRTPRRRRVRRGHIMH